MKTLKTLIVLTTVVGATELKAQELKANTEKTEISWVGKKVGGQHNGSVNLKSGIITVENDIITAGAFVIDMSSIKNLDIKETEHNQKLVDHLKSDDFFSVKKFPEAKLAITGKAPIRNNEAHVKGNLTIKGITNPVEFHVKRDGKNYITNVTIDRSKYNVRYGSKSFFNDLGDKIIHDNFDLRVHLVVD